MNILIAADPEEAEKVRKYIDLEMEQDRNVQYHMVKNCREAWENVSSNPILYEVIYAGRIVTDFNRIRKKTEGNEFDLQYLEEIYRKNPRILFFMCTSGNYLQVSHLSIPFLQIIKHPVCRDQVREMLRRVFLTKRIRYGRCHSRVAVYDRGRIRLISTGSIRYVRKVRNGILLITECGEIFNRKKMDEFAEEAGEKFLRCRGNLLVNIEHVRGFQRNRLEMDDGEELTVSRSCLDSVSRYFKRYNLFQLKEEI